MRSPKKFGVLVAVFALSAIGAANASAATFTSSATGSLTGRALEAQVFTTNGGIVECTIATTTGTIAKTADIQQHVTVNYGGCNGYGFATVDISAATYQFTSNGTVHIINTTNKKGESVPISITPTLFGGSICTVKIPPQTVGTVDYSNSGTNNVKVTPTVTGIEYTSNGGSCGTSGENGTYTGANEISGTAGQVLRFDP